MRGRWHGSTDKWNHVNQLVQTEKIGILALQETHLTPVAEMSLNNLFKQRLHIISSIDPQHTISGSVAIVLNKNIANVHNIKKYVLIPGHAMLVSVPWH
ncbi:hypothetical protein L208DRAFT_1514992 [Tricholoma matsutake]|nr:hypothetical protein L208DRAFT_1514992 [Tricholoma matsutake 945]